MRQITERGYPVAEVFQRPGVSQHSLYEWKKKFGALNGKADDAAEVIRRLKKELARVTEERDILKKIPGFGPPVRGGNKSCYDRRRRGVADCLLEPSNPLTNVAHGQLLLLDAIQLPEIDPDWMTRPASALETV